MKEVNNVGLLQRIESLNELAPLAADEGAFFLADSLYQEVDLLGSWLFEGNVYQQTEFVFNSKRMRGIVAYRVGKLDEARVLFDEASNLLDQMESMSPGQNLEHYQHLFFNIASLYYAEGKIAEALELNRKVLKIVQESKIPDENRKKLSLAYCHKYVGNCLWALGYQSYLDAKKHKTKDVMQLYREANDNYKQALSYNPKDAEAMAKYNLGELILQGMEKPMAMPKNF
jgi:tetratricopeptide (TPR) repeat protein